MAGKLQILPKSDPMNLRIVWSMKSLKFKLLEMILAQEIAPVAFKYKFFDRF